MVMRKLVRVAGLVVNFGEMCRKHNLEESDLPPGLRGILQSLHTYVMCSRRVIASSSYLSELDGIESALKQCTEPGRVKTILLRKDLLRKVKQYDSELFNVLQTFQVRYMFRRSGSLSKWTPPGGTDHGCALCTTG
jgi:hypothetical protein